jgi:hypothetical protein
MLKITVAACFLVAGGLILNGCTTDRNGNTHVNKTYAGAGIGAVGGGLLGSAVTGGSTAGTVVGAGAGAVGGGMVGNSMR